MAYTYADFQPPDPSLDSRQRMIARLLQQRQNYGGQQALKTQPAPVTPPPAPLKEQIMPRPEVAAPVTAPVTAPSVPNNPTLPNPAAATIEPSVGAPPAMNLPTPAPTPVRVGYGTAGLSGLERIQAQRQAMEEADPESKIKVTPDFVEVGPPGMKGVNRKGRFRSGLEASLSSLAHADPRMLDNHPLYMLGQGLGGLIGGIASPRTGAKIVRGNEIEDLQREEARRLGLGQEEAQLGNIEAQRRYHELEPAIENAKLELERQKAQGVIDDRKYREQKDILDRASREKTNATTAAATIEAARIRAQAGGGQDNNAIIDRNIEAIRTQQAKIDAELPALQAKLAKLPPTILGGTYGDQTVANPEYEILNKQVQDALGERNRLDTEIRTYEGRRKGGGSVSNPPPPPGVTEDSVRAAARKRNADEEEAVRKARGLGWIK